MRRKTAPLRKPAIAGIKDLRIPRGQIWSLPFQLGSNRRAGTAGEYARTHATEFPLLADAGPYSFSRAEYLQVPDPGSYSATLPMRVSPEQETPEHEQGSLAGDPASTAPRISQLPKTSPFVGKWRLRPYQREAQNALIETHYLLLADDPGMGKSVTAAFALASLLKEGQARRALIVCSGDRLRHWESLLATWAPGWIVNSVRNYPGRTARIWTDPAQIVLMDYEHLAAHWDRGSVKKTSDGIDIVILGEASAVLHYPPKIVAPLKHLASKWKWGLAGGLPRAPQEWIKLFEYLIPEAKQGELKRHLMDPCERFLPFVVRRRKADVADEMPAWTRQELWLDMQDDMRNNYQTVLAEERERLTRMGPSAGSTDIRDALHRLCQATTNLDDAFSGPKVQALISLVSEITRAGGRTVVFCHDHHGEMDQLHKALEAFGVARLNAGTGVLDGNRILESLRHDASLRVLIAHVEATTDGKPIEGFGYIVHVDCGLNTELSCRVEWQLFPSAAPRLPVNVYEFWMANTHEEQLHALLASRLPEAARNPHARPRPEWHRPLTTDEWLTGVFGIGSHSERALSSH